MEWVAPDRVDVVKVATPLALRVPVPRVAASSLNVIVPVGVPEPPEGVTVAVNVTEAPKVEVAGNADSPVVVAVRADPQPVNLNDPTRVLQLNAPSDFRYSLIYQKVQSSDGSMRKEL
jgi:hypothetical protein